MTSIFSPRMFRLPGVGIFLLALLLGMPGWGRGVTQEDLGPVEIRDIQFEGLKQLKVEDLKEKIQSKVGKPYDREKVREDLKRLGARAWEWPTVRSEKVDGGVRLIFVLKENPVLDSIEIVGNTKIETKELVKLVRVEPGQVLTQDLVTKARESVQKEYRDNSYVQTKVEANLAQKPGSEGKVLQILISEGEKKRVDDVVIEGNQAFSAFRLRMVLETKGSWLFVHNYLDERAFEKDLLSLRDFYQLRKGYFAAEVERGVFDFNEKKGTVTPRIVVKEGPRYVLRSVKTRGNRQFLKEEITVFFDKLIGKPFDGDDYNDAIKRVKNMYGAAGCVATEVKDEMQFDRAQGQVDLTVVIDEEVRARVGKILIERPNPIPDDEASWFTRTYSRIAPPLNEEVIRREVKLTPGEVYDKQKEAESVARLRRLNAFNDVTIESRAGDQPQTRDAVIRVQEGMTGNILVGVGYNEAYGGYVWGTYTENNLFGEANSLRLNAMVGTEEVNAGVSYLDRYLGDTQNSLLTEVRHINAHRPGYDEKNTGGLTELGTPLTDRWKLYTRARAEYVQLDDAGNHPEEDYNIKYGVGALRLRLVHDARVYENYHGVQSFESSGHLASMGIEGGYADGTLGKLTGSYDWYHKIGERAVFATDLNAGFLMNDANEIGPTERLYMGGTDDLRGYKFRHAGPHDPGDNDVPSGGATKLVARNELRYPLMDRITGLMFLDAGLLDHDAFTFDADPRASAGVGFRVGMKGVEAGVDLAAPINAQPDDQKRYFHVTLRGQQGFSQGNTPE
ncbi:MAG TPA: outer membrane protein assembly factor [Candidatus Sumerlaeota bacterium]|nr:outer membrane protein assembly factor [Candidatus Sumerlaeota bacterium]